MSAARRIAVIGAGFAGLTLARALQEGGRSVELFDKSRGAGGRCATRRGPAGHFDHGAPLVQAHGEAFEEALADWAARGWLAPLQPAEPAQPEPPGWAGVPSMNAWMRQLAQGLTIHTGCAVAALLPSQAGWTLRLAERADDAGPFEAVLLALPAEQAAALLSTAESPAADAIAAALRNTRSDPCWTVMAAWPGELPLPWTRWQGDDPLAALAQAWRQEARPGRRVEPGLASRWVLHATPHWSAHNLDARPEAVALHLCQAFADLAGARLARPVHAAAHRWRYAQQARPLAGDCAWDPAVQLGTCGDAYAAGPGGEGRPGRRGLERAWLSARALASHLLARDGEQPPPPPAPAG